MRVLLDPCVILDALQSRELFCRDAQSIFLLCANRQFEGFLTALRSGVDCIVTRNRKDYSKAPIPVYDPAEFIELLTEAGKDQTD